MKNFILIMAITIIGFSNLLGQKFEKHKEVTIYAGYQNPFEYAFLDFGGSGPKESFDPGPLFGMGIKQNARRISMGLRATYMHNQIKNFSDIEQDSDLHNLSLKGDFWLNVLDPDTKFRLEIGAGLGTIFFRHPGYTIIWDEDTDDPGRTYVEESYNSLTFLLGSGINLYYNLSEKISVLTALSNDFILYYGDEETAIQTSISIGLAYKL